MKKGLSLLLSLMVSASAFAGADLDKAFWIIKDGRLATGIERHPYDDLEGKTTSELVDAVSPEGENVMEYQQLSVGLNMLDAMLKFDTPLNLNENYVLVMDYKVPAAHADANLIEGNKPLFIFGFAQTIADMKVKNAPHSDVAMFIDGKWNNTGEWVHTERYIFSNPDFNSIAGMIFSYAREYVEGDLKEFPYIKNLAIAPYQEGVKPFYAEDYDGYGIDEFYFEKNSALVKKVKFYNGGIKPVVPIDDQYKLEDEGMPSLTYFRDFQPDSLRGTDGSGYMDTEILHALQVEPLRDYPVTYPGIQIPKGCNKIFASFLAKKHKNDGGMWIDSASFEEVEGKDLPIRIKFDTGEEVDLANDALTAKWTKFQSEIEVPAGATSCDLLFYALPMGYLVDEMTLSSVKYASGVKNIMASNNAFDIDAYVDQDGKIVVRNGKLVNVFNLTGRVAAESDNIVVIVVENEEGARASKVMLRK